MSVLLSSLYPECEIPVGRSKGIYLEFEQLHQRSWMSCSCMPALIAAEDSSSRKQDVETISAEKRTVIKRVLIIDCILRCDLRGFLLDQQINQPIASGMMSSETVEPGGFALALISTALFIMYLTKGLAAIHSTAQSSSPSAIPSVDVRFFF